MSEIVNPMIPFNGLIYGGMFPGRIVRVQGTVPGNSHKFAVNLLCGSSGDIALHVSPHFQSHKVVRNSVCQLKWGHEEHHGGLPIHAGHPFDMMILCDATGYKIAFNGVHFTEFHHRIPYHSVTNVAVDGQVMVHRIGFEGGPSGTHGVGGFAPAPHVPSATHGHMPSYPPSHGAAFGAYPAPGYPPSHQPPYGTHGVNHASHVPYPTQHGHSPYPTQPGLHHDSHLTPNPGYPAYPNSNTAYPHSPTGHKKTGFLDKAGMAVAGALGASALVGGHKYNKLGGGLGTALAGSALTGHLNPKKALKKQSKAQKKALKYGLPIAGAGLGAYALHKGLSHHHHHRRSSSSSSSSSSD